jgi:hypothetical protein
LAASGTEAEHGEVLVEGCDIVMDRAGVEENYRRCVFLGFA